MSAVSFVVVCTLAVIMQHTARVVMASDPEKRVHLPGLNPYMSRFVSKHKLGLSPKRSDQDQQEGLDDESTGASTDILDDDKSVALTDKDPGSKKASSISDWNYLLFHQPPMRRRRNTDMQNEDIQPRDRKHESASFGDWKYLMFHDPAKKWDEQDHASWRWLNFYVPPQGTGLSQI